MDTLFEQVTLPGSQGTGPVTVMPRVVIKRLRDLGAEHFCPYPNFLLDKECIYEKVLPCYSGQYRMLDTAQIDVLGGSAICYGSLSEEICRGHLPEQRVTPGLLRAEMAGHAFALLYRLVVARHMPPYGNLFEQFFLEGVERTGFPLPLLYGQKAVVYVQVLSSTAPRKPRAAWVMTAIGKAKPVPVGYGIIQAVMS